MPVSAETYDQRRAALVEQLPRLEKELSESGFLRFIQEILDTNNIYLNSIGHPDEWERTDIYPAVPRHLQMILRRSSLHRTPPDAEFTTHEVQLRFHVAQEAEVTLEIIGAKGTFTGQIPDMKSKSERIQKEQQLLKTSLAIAMHNPRVRWDFNAE